MSGPARADCNGGPAPGFLRSMTFFAPVLRIFIVDDHPVVVKGLRALLEGHAGWRVCGDAGDGLEAVERVCQLRPDVAILDITLPNLNGLEATRRILKQVPRTEILILTAHDSEMMVSKAMEAGAHGYLVKGEGGHSPYWKRWKRSAATGLS